MNNIADYLNIAPHKLQELKNITADSRKAQSGSLFFLLPRAKSEFARLAHEKGALVIHDRDLDFGHTVNNIDEAYSKTLQLFYKESFDALKIYGVTGTNGKTSFSFMLQTMLESYDVPAGIFGTIKNSFKNHVLDTGLTSPMAEDFYKFNHENYKQGMKAVVCEVSSHALDQKRLGIHFLSGAAFTSFSQDHLDYHKDMQTYLEAKLKITSEASKEDAFLVGHKTTKEYHSFKSKKKIYLGEDYSFNLISETINGLEINFQKKEKSISGILPMLGFFNAENFALALTVLCEHFGKDFFPDERVFKSFKQIPGRLEKIKLNESSSVFIDFSHTPDSLKKSLETLNTYKEEKDLVVVFGCGGDRDPIKRPLMGEIAEKLSDRVIVTSDNPRFEDPEAIIQDIIAQKDLLAISDRKKAIEKALEGASRKPSLVLIAGKGHEDYQEIQGVKHPFSDKEIVEKWLASS